MVLLSLENRNTDSYDKDSNVNNDMNKQNWLTICTNNKKDGGFRGSRFRVEGLGFMEGFYG